VAKVLAALLAAWALGSGALFAQAPRRYALLIGLNNYVRTPSGITPLSYARNDVEALRERLIASGFDRDNVVALINEGATRSAIVQNLYRYTTIVGPQDTFLLYFAGHGVRNQAVNQETYWLTYDSNLDVLDDAGIRLTHLLDFVRDVGADKKLVLLDHCFSGEVQRAAAGGSGGVRDGFGTGVTLVSQRGSFRPNDFERTLEDRAGGMVILAAAREGAQESEALESTDREGHRRKGHGLFTYALLQALGTRKADTAAAGETPDGKLTMPELVAFLRTGMRQIANDHGLAEQSVTEVNSEAVDLSSWELVASLPIDDLQERSLASQGYREKLNAWQDQGLIDFQTRIKCVNVLTLWEEALEDGRPLTEEEEKILDEVRNHLDSDDAPEDILADDLVRRLHRIQSE
jgi:hypothetical protein